MQEGPEQKLQLFQKVRKEVTEWSIIFVLFGIVLLIADVMGITEWLRVGVWYALASLVVVSLIWFIVLRWLGFLD